MIGELIALMFLSRDLAHRKHLLVSGPGAYAAHQALAEFYDGIVEIADEIAETYMGSGKEIEKIPLLAHKGGDDIIEILQAHHDWVLKNRYEVVEKEDTSIQNIIDEGVALYRRTLFKLRKLK